jgi:hypothetical protein
MNEWEEKKYEEVYETVYATTAIDLEGPCLYYRGSGTAASYPIHQ